jgi:hypothetical protein
MIHETPRDSEGFFILAEPEMGRLAEIGKKCYLLE